MKKTTIDSVTDHFRKADPILASVFATVAIEFPEPKKPDGYFVGLCGEIIGQQLSGNVADVIYGRFETLFPRKRVTPDAVLATPDETLRACGMSWSKVRFLKEIARAVTEKRLDFTVLGTLTDAEVLATLTGIRGIGPWTAEMFLMFTLGREDVFSLGDLGLKRAIQSLYKLKAEPTRRQMEILSRRWKPYRTYASLALWKYKDS